MMQHARALSTPILRLIALVLLIALFAISCSDSTPTQRVHFADITKEAGIDFRHVSGADGRYYYPETFGSGAATFDIDGDGYLDLYLLNGGTLPGVEGAPAARDALYKNDGRAPLHFTDISARALRVSTGYGMGAAVGDYDNDGDADLYLTQVGANLLLDNKNGALLIAPSAAHVADGRWGTGTTFLDYDNDGDLDLFAVNYVEFSPTQHAQCQRGSIRTYCEPTAYAPTRDVLYRNDGNSFSDRSTQDGITGIGRGLGLAAQDYDLDGDTDLLVANDGEANFLYVNEEGIFVERGLQRGGRFNGDGRAEAGMGTSWGDYDLDGWPDLFVGNFSYETHTLYRNEDGLLRDVSQRGQLDAPTYMPLAFGTFFFDFDNDRYLDLFAANVHVLDQIAAVDSALGYAQTDQLFHNIDGTHFVDITQETGGALLKKRVSRAALYADFDNDGDLDILVTATDDTPLLLRNDSANDHGWLALDLRAHTPADATGARAEIHAGDQRLQRQRYSSDSYLSASDPRLHFGLGPSEHVDVEIYWPDGRRQRLDHIARNQILTIKQP